MPDAGSWCIESVHDYEPYEDPNVGGGLPPIAVYQSGRC
ncbi:hypothetical protein C4J86_0359 [Pseudomonas sp. R2-7-07]|nr:hypothetical protein C4J86_0359 [Pseudomonas sp. R2-7-07]